MFKGSIILSIDPTECYNLSLIPSIKVLSMDEDDNVPELNPLVNSNVIKGTILLPPPEVYWAESDGDEERFKALYYEHLISKQCSEFIYTLLGYIYRGGTIVIYSKNINFVMMFIIEFFLKAYGINIGTSNTKIFSFDINCVPMYVIGIYSLGIMNPYEFLALMPVDAPIPNDIYIKLMIDINPYSSNNNYFEKKDYIDTLRISMHNTGKLVICPIKLLG